MKPVRFVSMLGVAAIAFALPFTAGATVKKEGSWPTVDKKVDLEFDGKASEGIKALAKEVGWSLVVSDPVAFETGRDVHVAVENQPADAVLEALFTGHDVVAYRNGNLITVSPAASGATPSPVVAPVPPVPPVPGVVAVPAAPAIPIAPPVPTVRGEDRNVVGGSLVIHKDEIVHTVTVAGGSLKVEGTVTGDLVVAGGSAKIASGARVVGNATVFGGSLKVENNGRIDGDVGIAGGSLHREDGAVIGGTIVDEKHAGKVKAKNKSGTAQVEVTSDGEESSSGRGRIAEAVHEFGQSMTKMSLLFVLGCVLLALVAPRMERIRVEIASRPMRTFALGLIGTLVGSLGALLMITVLCITIIGIPVALIGLLFAVLAVYGAIASTLTTFGAAVAGHRTQNPYVHLMIGCAAFLLVSSIPWIGGLVTFGVTMLAIGALITTRVGGLLDRRLRRDPNGLV
jgi:hypothetical protein